MNTSVEDYFKDNCDHKASNLMKNLICEWSQNLENLLGAIGIVEGVT